MFVISVSFPIENVKASKTANTLHEPSAVYDVNKVNRFIDSELIGTKIDIEEISLSAQSSSGYLYKNLSWNQKINSKTYLGKVTKGTSVSYGVTTARGFITIDIEFSSSREYYEYRIKGTITSTWGVYDRYSGNYMYSETFTNNTNYIAYTRVK